MTPVNATALEPPLQLPLALGALLCAGLVALPWLPWAGPAGVLAAALLPWLARRIPGARPYAPFSSVYAALAVLVLPPYSLESLFTGRFAAFFSTLALAYLIGAALDGVEGRTPWVWLGPLLCAAVFPSALGLAGGLGLALLGQLEPRAALRPHRPRTALIAAAGLLALATLLAVALPAPGGWDGWRDGQRTTPVPRVAPRAAPQPEAEPPPPASSRVTRAAPRDNPAGGDGLYVAVNLVLLFAVAGMLVALALVRARRSSEGRRVQLWDLMPLVATLVLMVAIILWSGLAPGSHGASGGPLETGGTGSGGRGAGSSVTETAPSTPARPAPGVTLTLLVLALAAGGYVLWRLRPRSFVYASEVEAKLNASEVGPEAATDEVRRCYVRFLELAGAHGLPRASTETALEFAARVAEIVPGAGEAAHTLTRLYEPVRYGARAAGAHAQEARTALETLEALLPHLHSTVQTRSPA